MRRAKTSHGTGISLFSFLNVMLCTMGALILLLVLIMRNVRAEATATAAQEAATRELEATTAVDDLRWRIDAMKESAALTQEQQAERRQKLAAIEEHIVRLSGDWTKLVQSAKSFAALGNDAGVTTGAAEAELKRLEAQIAAAQLDVQNVQKNASNNQPSYAVIPYRGPNGTVRRPFYIECLKDRIILQPEGVVFPETDFDGEIGPANPLAAALRAGRDYLASQNNASFAQQGEPYPLMLVRPDGIPAYNVARVACSSWGSDFGYEFIDAEWKLKYPQIDPGLAEAERQAAQLARERIARRAPAASGVYARRARPIYRASATQGGVVRADGSHHGYGGSGASAHGGSERTGGAFSPPPGKAVASDATFQPTDEDRGGATTKRQFGSSEAEGMLSQDRQYSPDGATSQGASQNGQPQLPGQRRSAQRGATGAPEGQQSSAAENLSKKRGRNWSLPTDAVRSIPIRRPLLIECRYDQLILMPEKGAAGGKSIALGERTESAVDELVRSVWAQTKNWGLAGAGMHWRPELVLEVGPGGEQRYADLLVLLQDSGLEVRRSE